MTHNTTLELLHYKMKTESENPLNRVLLAIEEVKFHFKRSFKNFAL